MNGLVLLDKPQGLTSFGAASRMKKAYQTKRVGHTGTLDPLATGVLPVLIGRATRLCQYMLEEDKRYIAAVRLGITTDTEDITGRVLTENKPNVSEEELQKAIASFIGTVKQVPPMYSAIRQNGKRLYELAREGKTVERTARTVTVHDIKLLWFDGVEFAMEVHCSKGTYIRTLSADIGRKLGCGATMTALRRTEVAGVSIAECVTIDEVFEDPAAHLLPADRVVAHFPSVTVTGGQATRFQNGGELSLDRLTLPETEQEVFRVYFGDTFLGIGNRNRETGLLEVACVIAERKDRDE